MIAGVALAVIVAAVTISTRRPVAIAEEDVARTAIAPPAPTEPGEAVEDTVQVEREPIDGRRIEVERPSNADQHGVSALLGQSQSGRCADEQRRERPWRRTSPGAGTLEGDDFPVRW